LQGFCRVAFVENALFKSFLAPDELSVDKRQQWPLFNSKCMYA
jgi:hypothetical protein